ncbi:hypothetical protein D2V05_13075 [Flagellimonas pelagia]|uniref:Uncharacterized protein n=1 Tax=Flagellimonas pelagia TaxID=2306998 RepID=A0A3A1NIA9_9FLAO|nr:hypothetical protein D2V05_13075 [Allomuricauda maritima]
MLQLLNLVLFPSFEYCFFNQFTVFQYFFVHAEVEKPFLLVQIFNILGVVHKRKRSKKVTSCIISFTDFKKLLASRQIGNYLLMNHYIFGLRGHPRWALIVEREKEEKVGCFLYSTMV